VKTRWNRVTSTSFSESSMISAKVSEQRVSVNVYGIDSFKYTQYNVKQLQFIETLTMT